MYAQHFGLKKRPFPAVAAATDVFVGPQTARAMATIKKALALQDSAVVVTGPAGSGKSAITGRALDTLAGTHRAIRIGRIHLDSADVLEFLLEELGDESVPAGAIRRFRAFRQHISALNAAGRKLVLVVEDAVHMGADTLAELEALTASDAGESEGAALVLQADHRIEQLLRDPQLARLGQRIRQRLEIQALSSAEMRGYCMHCFRLAGADFESIFDDRAAAMLHGLSAGVPRVANQLVEATLAAATSTGLDRIPTAFLAEVAKREFGLANAVPPAAPRQAPMAPALHAPDARQAEPDSAPVPAKTMATVTPRRPAPEGGVTTHREPSLVPRSGASATRATTDDNREAAAEAASGDEEVPQLIQDTLPDLAILSSEFADERETTAELEPESAGVTEDPPVPDAHDEDPAEPALQAEGAAEPVSESSPQPAVPDWDRDPTCAELMPDLDALERAMAIAQDKDDDDEAPPMLTDIVEKKPAAAKPSFEEMPEITLDDSIRSRIENNLIDEPGQISPTLEVTPAVSKGAAPEIKLPPRQTKKADAELERIASELAKAKTLEDVDDKLAETLFGEELNLIAAQVLAGRPQEASANEEMQLAAEEPARVARAASGSIGVMPDAPRQSDLRPADPAAPQRLQTVPAFSGSEPKAARGRADNLDARKPASTKPAEPPVSIEDQITSMTQTLKALNVRPPISSESRRGHHDDDDDEDDGDDDGRKSGFFSRFRRS